jgi:hypothetical protein
MKSRRGQLGSLPGIIATLIVVAIMIAAGFFIMQEFFEQDTFVDTSGSVTNETGFYFNGTTYTVDKATTAGFNTFAVTNIVDSVTNVTLLSGNYTTDADLGTIVNATADADDTNEHYVSYTYLYGEAGYEGVDDTLDAMGTIPDLLPLIILIIMVGIILAVVFTVVPGSRNLGA